MVATSCLEPDPTAGQADASLGGCPLFPRDNVWHANVRMLPVHARSAAWVTALGRSNPVHPDFGSGTWEGKPIGFPVTVVGGNQAKVPVGFTYASESDPGPYPLPFDVAIEGGPTSDGDRHVIVVNSAKCKAYELYNARPGATPSSAWSAGSGAIWDLRSNATRPENWTSADAAGLPMLPGLVRYDEVAAGNIDHAIRFTMGTHARRHDWPARHLNDSGTDPNLPPMGAWFRLKAGYDTSWLGPQARGVAEAMKNHGIIAGDVGASWFLSGAPDPRWNNPDLLQLRKITGDAFEAVDPTGIKIDPNSAQARIVTITPGPVPIAAAAPAVKAATAKKSTRRKSSRRRSSRRR